jgi:hypothetical protein
LFKHLVIDGVGKFACGLSEEMDRPFVPSSGFAKAAKLVVKHNPGKMKIMFLWRTKLMHHNSLQKVDLGAFQLSFFEHHNFVLQAASFNKLGLKQCV